MLKHAHAEEISFSANTFSGAGSVRLSREGTGSSSRLNLGATCRQLSAETVTTTGAAVTVLREGSTFSRAFSKMGKGKLLHLARRWCNSGLNSAGGRDIEKGAAEGSGWRTQGLHHSEDSSHGFTVDSTRNA
jgi:hypothetical protein